MSFDTDEKSVSQSRPREIYEITHGTTTYYIASGQRDVVYNGHNFIATPAARGELLVSPLTGSVDFVLTLPANHALAQRYVAMGGVPPRQILVTVRRKQLTSGEVQQIWVGYALGTSFKKHSVEFRIPSRVSESLNRLLPSVLVDSVCPNILYDAWCTVNRGSFVVSTTAVVVNGRTLSVVSVGGTPDGWALFGELLHVSSQERMTIWGHTGNQITMQLPIPELHTGDSVQIFAGCDHAVATCRDKFNNVVNFAGLPQRPTTDLFLPTNFGVESIRS